MSKPSRHERAAVAMADHTEGELAAMVVDLEDEVTLLTHKVITCGVAASHPDATLSRRGAYRGAWDSPQAEEVRTLRSAGARLSTSLARLLSVIERLGPVDLPDVVEARAAIEEWEKATGVR